MSRLRKPEIKRREVTVYRQMTFKKTVEPLTGYDLKDEVLVDGVIEEVLMHFPDGCDSLVDIAVDYEGERVIPEDRGKYIALNDATPVFKSNTPVLMGKEVWVTVNNYDDTFPHTVTVVVTVKGTMWVKEEK